MAQTGFTPIQLYSSSTATNVPLAANLATGELAINITDGKLFYKDNAAAVQVIGWKVVPATAGGTGQTSYAVGDLLYANTTTTLAKLADVATGNALISGGIGVAPSYGKIGLTTHISGVLPVANGGTNASTASITAFNNITGYSASGATGTTTTNLVFSTSPSITTPTLVGDVTVSTGNVVIGTSGKGVTSGNFSLGLGANGNTSAILIDTTNRALINTTTVGGGAGGSTILTAVSLSGQDAVFIKGAGSSAGNLPLGLWNDAGSGDNALLYFYTNNTIAFKGGIDYNRAANLIRYNTSSDGTLKNIIGDSSGERSVEILKTTRLRDYTWKDDPDQKVQMGPIAQELYETYKGAVSVGGDVEKIDDEGNVTTQYRPWAIDKTAYSFHLVAGWQAHEKTLQEQKLLIEQLTARIAALEAK